MQMYLNLIVTAFVVFAAISTLVLSIVVRENEDDEDWLAEPISFQDNNNV